MRDGVDCIPISACRICGGADLRQVIDLGDQYIAGIFARADVPGFLQTRFPLELVRCAIPDGCGLVQLKHSVSPSVLYSDYGYRSGINRSMREHLAGIADAAARGTGVKHGDTILDIGCNDGTLLAAYGIPGLDRLGFEPAKNVALLAKERGLDVVNDFFSAEAYRAARPGVKAKVVTSIAMFYDLEDPQGFTRDVAAVLADDGVWIIELSYLPLMLKQKSFDTVCHEHLEYYALRQIEWMVGKAQLRVHRVEFNDVNGGSVRVYIRKALHGTPPSSERETIERVRRDEQDMGLGTDAPYEVFRDQVQRIRGTLRELLGRMKAEGKSIYVYGASTKGNTLLQFCGIDHTIVGKAADRNPDKWGRRTLGTEIPIVSEEEARADHPDFFLVLPWHFLPEFLTREAAFLEGGGRFIVPLPDVRVIGEGTR